MYEYRVIPAPLRTAKVKGLKTSAERFAHLLEGAVNAEAGEGWEFLRAETLPCEERKGLTGVAKSFQSVLVFRRALGFADESHIDAGYTDSDQDDGEYPAPFAADTPDQTASGQPARLSLVATRHEPETRAPLAGQQTNQQTGHPARQEPVLRPGAALHASAGERPEPVLRTRALDESDTQG